MTRDDYIAWAEEYRRDADVLSEKIRTKQELLRSRFASAAERSQAERAVGLMLEMRENCLESMKKLIAQAESIKE